MLPIKNLNSLKHDLNVTYSLLEEFSIIHRGIEVNEISTTTNGNNNTYNKYIGILNMNCLRFITFLTQFVFIEIIN